MQKAAHCLGGFMKNSIIVATNRSKWIAPLIVILAFSVASFAQTPALVYSKSLSATNESGNNFKIQYGGSMGTGTLANNLLVLTMTYPAGATVSSIVDNKSSVYSFGVSTTSGWTTAAYYVAGVPSGITQIAVNFSGAVADWHGAIREFSGVATNSPIDGTCSNNAAAPSLLQCGTAISTSTSGDLILASTMLVGGLGSSLCGNTSTSIDAGANFILDSADPYCSDAEEEYIQSAAGTINPSFAITGNRDAFNFIAMAFKAATAGTRPTGMYILHQQTIQIDESTSSQLNYFVSGGNLLVASVDDGNTNSGGNIVTIDSCSPSNTWTKRSPSGPDAPQILFVPSASTSTSMSCTIHSGMPSDTTLVVIYDVVGAASSPEDVDSQYYSTNGTTVNGPTVTPTAEPGIAFAVEETGNGPSTKVGTGFVYDNTPYNGETDSSKLNNGDGWQHIFYTSTSPLAFSWTQANSSSTMAAFAITFKAGAPAAPAAPVITSALSASAVVGSPFSYSILASAFPSSYDAVGLPSWASVNTVTGLISGTPTAVGSTTATISATNNVGTGNSSLTIIVQAVVPVVTVTVSPTSTSINTNATLQFSAVVTGATNKTVTWSSTCGSINTSGFYTAPATASSCQVTATSVANTAVSASANVTVVVPAVRVTVTVSPTSTSINTNATLQFSAVVTGTTNKTVTWSSTCGSINRSGFYTAPATASSCQVTATSVANTAVSASANVTVLASGNRGGHHRH